jgi:glyoxylase-like metal-dependent hydrolase (beta-lactamase superfamily II)
MRIRTQAGLIAVVMAAVCGLGRDLIAQGQVSAGGIETVSVRPNFFMIVGSGGNIAVQVGEDGPVIVDSGTERTAEAALAAAGKLSARPIRYIINTSAGADHVGGNVQFARAGQPLAAPGAIGAFGQPTGAPVVATENVLLRMSAPTGEQSPYPVAAWPTETFTGKRKTLYLNDEGIEVIAAPAAHTDGDAMVFFRRSDVVVSGEVFDVTHFPVIDVARGGGIEGEIAALNRLIELTIPSIPLPSKAGGTRVVPARGRICEQADVVEYRDMVTIVRDRVDDLMKSGKTLAQIQASSPTQGWTRRYGVDAAPAFVEAIYKSLTATRTKADGGRNPAPARAPQKGGRR